MNNIRWNNLDSLLYSIMVEPYNEKEIEGIYEHAVENIEKNKKVIPPHLLNTHFAPPIQEVDNLINHLETRYLSHKEDRLKWLYDLKRRLSFMSERTKLSWNGRKNALVDIFRQLKEQPVLENGEPMLKNGKAVYLISSTYEDIARMLLENFDCFSDTKYTTVLTTLKKKQNIKPDHKVHIISEVEKK